MSRQVYVTQSGAGTTNVIPTELFSVPFNASIYVTIVSGAMTYAVQHTPDNPNSFQPTFNQLTANWYTLAAMAGLTASSYTGITSPTSAVRLNVTAGTGTAVMAFIQSGAPIGSR